MRPQDFPRQPDRALAVAIAAARHMLARAMAALGSASDAQVVPCYLQLVDAAEQAFRVEELAAERAGYRAVREQRERHARALSALHQACTRIQDGDHALAREALVLLSRFLLMQRPGRGLSWAAGSRAVRPRRRLNRPGRVSRGRCPQPLLRLPGS